MRIQILELKNINSLYGRWRIDFTAREFADSGIFAIVGPTGAGKSSILDAVSLALYAETPRINSISKKENEVMSRGEGDAFASVVFETNGKQYLSKWSQQRARKKADGALQNVTTELSEYPSGIILATKKKEFDAKIRAVTGMDFPQFTRSLLLAQGRFSEFLLADGDNRSPVLENITGTEIYSKISMDSHLRAKEENDRLALIQAELSGMTFLTPEERTARGEELRRAAAEGTKKNAELKYRTAVRERTARIAALTMELEKISVSRQKWKEDVQLFEPDEIRLARAEKAAGLEPIFTRLNELRSNARKRSAQIASSTETLQKLYPGKTAAERLLAESERKVRDANAQLAESRKLFQRVRELDVHISARKKEAETIASECEKRNTDLTENRKQHTLRLKALEERKTADSANEIYRKTWEKDGTLPEILPGLQSIFQRIAGAEILKKSFEKELAAQRENQQKIESEIKKILSKKEIISRDFSTVEPSRAEAASRLETLLAGKLHREYSAERDALIRERMLLHKIESLEAERKQLRSGLPCPLCGATEHPFAVGLPETAETEKRFQALNNLLEQLDSAEKTLAELETRRTILEHDRKNCLETENGLRKQSEESRQKIESSQTELAIAGREIERVRMEFEVAAAPFQPNGNQAEKVLPELEERSRRFQHVSESLEKSRIQREELEKESVRLAEREQFLTGELRTKIELRDAAELARQELRRERDLLFGTKNPDVEEKKQTDELRSLEKLLENRRRAHDELLRQIIAEESVREKSKAELAEIQAALPPLETEFQTELQKLNFESEKSFVPALLPYEIRKELNSKRLELQLRRRDLETRENVCREQLAELEPAAKDDPTPGENEKRLAELEAEIEAIQERSGAAKQALENDARLRERQSDFLKTLERQKAECGKWNRLKELIGSENGKKFRNFAQGLTFEIMVNLANRELVKMNRRFLLVRDENEPLELNVVDNEQGGEIRSTRNLSGGESFVVSLALALGLSGMAGQKTRIDTLFLDEGFGSLDENALDMALSALTELHHTGKTIGIISHVASLKERIACRLEVSRLPGGRGSISGPGVTSDP